MKNTLVAGGGLSGLCAAALLAKQGCQVHIVEREAEIGGLLRSLRAEGDRTFDYGTHFLAESGTPLDEELFSSDFACRRISELRGGTHFKDRLNETSPCLDLTVLPQATHDRIVVEMLQSTHSENCSDLSEFYAANYSPTLEREVVAPVLGKFLPCALKDLQPDGARPLLHPRFVALDETTTCRLKKLPELDRVFAYHRPIAPTRNLYPEKGGIGSYAKYLAARLERQGVRISTGQTIKNLRMEQGQIVEVIFSDGERQPIDLLAWTLPSSLFLQSAGLSTAQKKPALQAVTLLHLEIDQPFQTRLHYLYCYDADRHLPKDLRLFRVTFYPNFSNETRSLCTLELFGDGTSIPDLAERALRELVHLQVAPAGSRLLYSHAPLTFPGFPLWTNELARAISEDCASIHRQFSNVRLLAKARGRAFLMNEIIHECLEVLG